jgi:hypothetical protein
MSIVFEYPGFSLPNHLLNARHHGVYGSSDSDKLQLCNTVLVVVQLAQVQAQNHGSNANPKRGA